jgi:hypothetical protein
MIQGEYATGIFLAMDQSDGVGSEPSIGTRLPKLNYKEKASCAGNEVVSHFGVQRHAFAPG